MFKMSEIHKCIYGSKTLLIHSWLAKLSHPLESGMKQQYVDTCNLISLKNFLIFKLLLLNVSIGDMFMCEN